MQDVFYNFIKRITGAAADPVFVVGGTVKAQLDGASISVTNDGQLTTTQYDDAVEQGLVGTRSARGSVDSGDTMIVGILTDQSLYKIRFRVACTDICSVNFSEADGFVGSTSTTWYQRNRSASSSIGATFISNVSDITNESTVLAEYVPGTIFDTNELWILEPNMCYLVKATNVSGTTQRISIVLNCEVMV